jgi:catechol-2,3-dioxygenase
VLPIPPLHKNLYVASIHGLSESIYLYNPDGNGAELYWDRPQEDWPKNEDSSLQMFTKKNGFPRIVSPCKSKIIILGVYFNPTKPLRC